VTSSPSSSASIRRSWGGPTPTAWGGVALAGSPVAVREYMDEYLATGANYFVCSFQWGDLTHAQAMRSLELFSTEVMPRYAS
jgi:alkanesulfonate monooxygenase SsuD/methylene tetrahydromethanopterin reductase-like flavin-dependent oxidoreductase (luciferase family)